jgi:hypothetical protein
MIILFPVQETRQNPHSAPMRPKLEKGGMDGSQALTSRSLCVQAGIVNTLPEGQGQIAGERGRWIAGRLAHLLRRFLPSIYSF